MKIYRFSSQEEWLNFKSGKISGSRLKDMLPDRYGKPKKGKWVLVAERLIGAAAINDDEKAMDRGHRLEPDAVERFVKETGKKVDSSLIAIVRDDDESIMVSPDAMIGNTEALEIKCLNAASHVEALITRKIPKNTAGYEEQMIQYFICAEKLRKLYLAFYDPRFPSGLDFFYLTITRKEIQTEIDEYLAHERELLKEVRDTVNMLTMYSPEEIKKMQEVREELFSTQYEVTASIAIEIEKKSASKRALVRIAEGIIAEGIKERS